MKQDYKMKVEMTFNGQGCSDNTSIYFEEYEETFQLEFENILIQNCSIETLCTVDNVGIECYNKSTQRAGKEGKVEYDELFLTISFFSLKKSGSRKLLRFTYTLYINLLQLIKF
jgi:hypothetical protein